MAKWLILVKASCFTPPNTHGSGRTKVASVEFEVTSRRCVLLLERQEIAPS